MVHASNPHAASFFRLPGGDNRTIVIGATGTGKTTFALWLLSRQRFDVRPWIIIDFKDEPLLDEIGFPPLRELKIGQMPGKVGLYVVYANPGQEEEIEAWLWKLWHKRNIGLFIDEATLLPQKDAMKAILRQGRSRLLPVIACTQRPVEIDREFFTEASFVALFRLDDERDYKVVRGFSGIQHVELPRHWCQWRDKDEKRTLILRPSPPKATIVQRFRAVLPRRLFLGL